MILTLRPLLSALRRNPTGALLVSLQIAITLAVLVNAASIVHQRIELIERPAGINTRDTFALMLSSLSKQFNVAQAESEDITYLRSLPGVTAATLTLGIPMTGYGSSNAGLWRMPGQRGTVAMTNVLRADSQTLRTLQVPLIAGRNFTADEIRPLASGKPTRPPSEIIMTQALARVLFAHGHALGRTVYDYRSDPLTIIGITRNFIGAVDDSSNRIYQTALLPTTPGTLGFYTLLVRTQPGKRDAILRAARQHIGAAHRRGVIFTTMTLSSAQRGFESNSRNVALFLTAVTTLMLAVCCLGIFGLTTFNVGSRTRQIGTQRALGARRRDIVSHFLVENGLVLSAGALLGSVLALLIGDWLTAHYALPRLNLAYLLAGILALATVGELAAWQPARRAARIPPSVATRTI